MRNILLLVSFLCISASIHSQDCHYDYDYTPNVKIHKDHVLSESKQLEWLDDISQLKKCLDLATSQKEIYWLNNSIANRTFFIDDMESIVQYAVKAFEADTLSFCNDYMSVYEASLIKDYSFDSYYINMDTHPRLIDVKSYCHENYESQFNQEYVDELEKILIRDQQERKYQPVNWEIQNRLDSMNRETLDSLYTVFGFPSTAKVTYPKIQNAFMVMRHSTDCEWNEKWVERWLEHNQHVDQDLFSLFFYRNYNEKDGMCKENVVLLDKLKNGKYSALVTQYLDFRKWDRFMK